MASFDAIINARCLRKGVLSPTNLLEIGNDYRAAKSLLKLPANEFPPSRLKVAVRIHPLSTQYFPSKIFVGPFESRNIERLGSMGPAETPPDTQLTQQV